MLEQVPAYAVSFIVHGHAVVMSTHGKTLIKQTSPQSMSTAIPPHITQLTSRMQRGNQDGCAEGHQKAMDNEIATC